MQLCNRHDRQKTQTERERESRKDWERHFEKPGCFFFPSISLPGTCSIINHPDDSAGMEAEQTDRRRGRRDTLSNIQLRLWPCVCSPRWLSDRDRLMIPPAEDELLALKIWLFQLFLLFYLKSIILQCHTDNCPSMALNTNGNPKYIIS